MCFVTFRLVGNQYQKPSFISLLSGSTPCLLKQHERLMLEGKHGQAKKKGSNPELATTY
jgi:hypothetical protein